MDVLTSKGKVLVTDMANAGAVKKLDEAMGGSKKQITDVTTKNGEVFFNCDTELDLRGMPPEVEVATPESLFSLLRELISVECLVEIPGKPEMVPMSLAAMTFPESSFSAQMNFINSEKYWNSVKLFYNDYKDTIIGLDKLNLWVPKTPLETREHFLVRKEEVSLQREGKDLVYDLAGVSQDIAVDNVLPLELTSEKFLVMLRYLHDAYSLITKLIAEETFEKEDGKSEPWDREKTAYGGYVKLSSSLGKINQTLRKYEEELDLLIRVGVDNSAYYKNHSLFRMFCTLYSAYDEAKTSGIKSVLPLYNAMRNSRALIGLMLLEIKMSLFYYEQEYLMSLVTSSGLGTAIPGYKIAVEPGGTSWHPTR
jgi:hypothetical protein